MSKRQNVTRGGGRAARSKPAVIELVERRTLLSAAVHPHVIGDAALHIPRAAVVAEHGRHAGGKVVAAHVQRHAHHNHAASDTGLPTLTAADQTGGAPQPSAGGGGTNPPPVQPVYYVLTASPSSFTAKAGGDPSTVTITARFANGPNAGQAAMGVKLYYEPLDSTPSSTGTTVPTDQDDQAQTDTSGQATIHIGVAKFTNPDRYTVAIAPNGDREHEVNITVTVQA